MELIISLSIMTIISFFACRWAAMDQRKLERGRGLNPSGRTKKQQQAKVVEMELHKLDVEEKLTMHTLKQMQECQLN